MKKYEQETLCLFQVVDGHVHRGRNRPSAATSAFPFRTRGRAFVQRLRSPVRHLPPPPGPAKRFGRRGVVTPFHRSNTKAPGCVERAGSDWLSDPLTHWLTFL